jgi:integrase
MKNEPAAIRHTVNNAALVISEEHNPFVTALSRFEDSVWLFDVEMPITTETPSHKRIDWGRKLTNGHSLLEPQYASMLLSLKELAKILFEGTYTYRLTPSKVIGASYGWHLFASFLVARPVPVYRFSDALPSDISAYLEYLKSRPGRGGGAMSTATLAIHYSQINYLYDLREYISDGLRFRPTGEKSAMAAAHHKPSNALQTQYIPDEEAKTLLTECIAYVETYAPILFDCWKSLSDYRKNTWYQELSLGRRVHHIHKFVQQYRPSNLLASGTPFDKGFLGIRHYNNQLHQLRIACFILIGFSTGMRISEIASIKSGCLSTEEMRNHGTFHWLTGVSYKTERFSKKDKVRSGVVRKWMCGKLAAKAISVLEEMSVLLGANKDTPHLFTDLNQVVAARGKVRRPFKPAAGGSLRSQLTAFCRRVGIHRRIHPHMFRRTFARNIVRVDSTALLALKEHFNHWSLYMTDWYVGLDPDLITEYEAERQLLSIEAMEKICVSKVSGPGGRRWTLELNKRIEEGTLPRNFRGKAGSEFRKSLIKDIHGMGSLVTPCGDFTYCVFNKDRALCTDGDSPVTSRCNPLGCGNSFITEEHVPAHKLKLKDDESFYKSLSEAERQSPLGETYRQEIAKRRKILEPFEG